MKYFKFQKLLFFTKLFWTNLFQQSIFKSKLFRIALLMCTTSFLESFYKNCWNCKKKEKENETENITFFFGDPFLQRGSLHRISLDLEQWFPTFLRPRNTWDWKKVLRNTEDCKKKYCGTLITNWLMNFVLIWLFLSYNTVK